MNYEEKTISSEKIFIGRIIGLRVDKVLLPDGNIGTREIIEHNGGVGVVAIKDNKLIMVRQFRKPFEEVTMEIPAGRINVGEDPYECALREMEEETGLIPQKLQLMTILYTTPGFSNEKLYLYFCNEFSDGVLNRDEDEFLNVEYFQIDELAEMIKKGEISDAKTISGLLMYMQFFK